MFNTRNSATLLIGKSIARTASVQFNSPSTTSTFLADGEILVLDQTGAVMTAGMTYADTKFIQLVQRSGATTNPLLWSARINGGRVEQFKGKSYEAPQEQITFIGYNGSSGSIDATGTDTFKLRIAFKHNKDIYSQHTQQRYFEYVPVTGATGQDIAASFAVQLGSDTDLTEVKTERICNDAGTAEGDTATVTNGSTTVTLTGTAAGVVAGAYVRFGTAVTDPVYKVASETNTGTNIVLDQPYQGTSASGVTIETITEALADAASFGLKFTGKALTFTVGKFKYTKVSFDLAIANFGATTITKTQSSKVGSGTYEQVAEYEWFAQGFNKAADRVGDSAPTIRADATSGSTYDIISLVYSDASEAYNTISGAKASYQELHIALVDGAAQATNILAVLNPWLASVPASFSAVVI